MGAPIGGRRGSANARRGAPDVIPSRRIAYAAPGMLRGVDVSKEGYRSVEAMLCLAVRGLWPGSLSQPLGVTTARVWPCDQDPRAIRHGMTAGRHNRCQTSLSHLWRPQTVASLVEPDGVRRGSLRRPNDAATDYPKLSRL